jgi:hypothetical protein
MARTAIAVQDLVKKGDKTVAFVAVDDANGMYFNNTGREVIVVKSQATSGVTMTVLSVACSHGRTGDKTVVVGASEDHMVYALPPDEFNQAGADAGKVFLNFAAKSGTVQIAVVRA